MKRIIVTGAAGFIGSNLVDYLLSKDYEVLGLDNFSTGNRRFIETAMEHTNFKIVTCDLLDKEKITQYFQGYDFIFHLAANADVRFGTDHPHKDLEQNTIVTFNVLEAMRTNSIKNIAFSSTGAIYGETQVIPTPEDCPMPMQTSLYGASKLACEGLIEAYCEGFDFQSWIFRFVSVLGERYTHGHVFDFYKKLSGNSDSLSILGNGRQTKSYIYVKDCIEAMILGAQKAKNKVNIFNLGTPETIEVFDSIKIITEFMDINPKIIPQDSIRGWVGDNPNIFLDTTKINSFGWQPRVSIRDGIIETLKWLRSNEWVF